MQLPSPEQHSVRFSRRGAAIIEFALILPVLLLCIIGILDYGLILFTQEHMVQAAREAVRLRAAEGPDPDTPRAQQFAENYLAAVEPSNAEAFTVTVSGTSDANAWVQVTIPLVDASLTGGLFIVGTGNLIARVEMEYTTHDP